MRGVVASGSVQSAEAAAEILELGGSAVDAAVAACLATGVGEPSLTSLAGGGLLLHREGSSGRFSLCDFFSNAPGLGSSAPPLDFQAIEIDFGPATQQFHIGRAAAAVPGTIPGLFSAQERWGRLPLREIVAPACRKMREGVTLNSFQAFGIKLLEPILSHSEGCRRLFAPSGRLVQGGERFFNPDLADTLEALAAEGWRRFYDGEICRLILEEQGLDRGGLLTPEDLKHYQVKISAPLQINYRDRLLLLPDSPAIGGELVALGLAALEGVSFGASRWGQREHLQRIRAAMQVMDESREHPGSALENLPYWRARLQEILEEPGRPKRPGSLGPGSTTHVSVIDAEGNAAAVTFSYGEGNGHILGRSGIHMNNLMGEADLHPGGFHTWPPGERLATGMCPSALLNPKTGDLSLLGTGGANRIRSAILQVIVNLVEFDMEIQAAVERSRIHWEAGVLNAELEGIDRGALEGIKLPQDELVLFEPHSMFFGGVHAVRCAGDGHLSGVGDHRRMGETRRLS